MAIEKLNLVNVVGKNPDIDRFQKVIYLFNDLELIDAYADIDEGRFTIPVSEENIDEIMQMARISRKSKKTDPKIGELKEKLLAVYKDLKVDKDLLKDTVASKEEILKETEDFIDYLDRESGKLQFSKESLEKTKQSINYYSYLSGIDIPVERIKDLKFFKVQIGSLTPDNARRLKLIYPSIPSVIFELESKRSSEKVFMVLTLLEVDRETERVLKALDFMPLEGEDPSFIGTPDHILGLLHEKEAALTKQIEGQQSEFNGLLERNRKKAELLYNELLFMESSVYIEDMMAFSDKNFYFSAWVPEKRSEELKNLLGDGYTVIFEKPLREYDPPTKLKNNWIFRPFEQLVLMYGIPNYYELDPTPFLSITYIFCFGYMFGDVGQGIVPLLAGLFAEKKGIKLGGVFARISIASIIFGFLYGSVFGIETILPALWLRPMDDTNTLLLTAVVCGVVMLLVAYIYGLINKRREHEEREEYFGKNGLSGLIIYVSILVLVLMLYHFIPFDQLFEDVIIVLIVICTLLVFLAVPLMNVIHKRKFTYDVDGQYYVSSFFEVFEMYLSMLSNTISFIRVGAFALTHVGMFMAFQTIADMVGGGIDGIIVLIIGNIFIIGLEGLIDYIQCLRLEFYELFGKYYTGNGREFVTIEKGIK